MSERQFVHSIWDEIQFISGVDRLSDFVPIFDKKTGVQVFILEDFGYSG